KRSQERSYNVFDIHKKTHKIAELFFLTNEQNIDTLY
ncbi:hypothetical protein M090_3129, partial [Parabacteroides distasonis str. 3776 Po2 i]